MKRFCLVFVVLTIGSMTATMADTVEIAMADLTLTGLAQTGNNVGNAANREAVDVLAGVSLTEIYTDNSGWGNGGTINFTVEEVFDYIALKAGHQWALYKLSDVKVTEILTALSISGPADISLTFAVREADGFDANPQGKTRGLSHFTIYDPPRIVPEPTSLFLLGAALMALAACRRLS